MEFNDQEELTKSKAKCKVYCHREQWTLPYPGQESSQCLPIRFSHCYGQLTDVYFTFISFFLQISELHHCVLIRYNSRQNTCLLSLLIVWPWENTFQTDEKTVYHQDIWSFELHAIIEREREECDVCVGIRVYMSMSWPEAETASWPIKPILPLLLGTELDFSQTSLQLSVATWLNPS